MLHREIPEIRVIPHEVSGFEDERKHQEEMLEDKTEISQIKQKA